MVVFILWIFFSCIVGYIGNSRRIGLAGAFFLSLLLSPIIGLIITLISKDNETERYKQQVLETQQKQAESLSSMRGASGIADQLERLQKLKEAGHLTEAEYQVAKSKLFV